MSQHSTLTTNEVVPQGTELSRGEMFVRRLLFVKARPPSTSVHRSFNVSVVVSGLRCLLTYVIAPTVLPATTIVVVPEIGIGLSVLAIGLDIRALRRFWAVDHPRRWEFTALYGALITFVLALLIIDAWRLAR